MPASLTPEWRAKWLPKLFWSGAGLASLAMILLVVAQSALLLRAAAVAAIMAVVLIGLSIALRNDLEDARQEIEDAVLEEGDAIREDTRDDLVAAARKVHSTLREEIAALADELEQLRAEVAAGGPRGWDQAAGMPPGGSAASQWQPRPPVTGHRALEAAPRHREPAEPYRAHATDDEEPSGGWSSGRRVAAEEPTRAWTGNGRATADEPTRAWSGNGRGGASGHGFSGAGPTTSGGFRGRGSRAETDIPTPRASTSGRASDGGRWDPLSDNLADAPVDRATASHQADWGRGSEPERRHAAAADEPTALVAEFESRRRGDPWSDLRGRTQPAQVRFGARAHDEPTEGRRRQSQVHPLRPDVDAYDSNPRDSRRDRDLDRRERSLDPHGAAPRPVDPLDPEWSGEPTRPWSASRPRASGDSYR